MTNKRSRAFTLLGSLLAAFFLIGGFVGCSLETSDFSEATLTKKTYVRANRPIVAAKPAKRPYHGVQHHRRTHLRPPVRLAAKTDYRRYAVAYGNPYAVVHDNSIIPIALQSKHKPLKRLELNIFKRKRTAKKPEVKLPESRIRVRTTAYTHNEADHRIYGRKNAIGTRLQFGKVRSAAADWSRYPLGTEFRIVGQPGITYIIDDYGSALVGTGTIDLYKPTFGSMNRWGVRHVDIEVTKWGSFSKSLHILSPRTRWSHVRRMVASIRKLGSTDQARMATLSLTQGV